MIPKRNATELLQAAINTFNKRGCVYGDANDHYHGLAKLQSAFFSTERTPRDVTLADALEKLDRAQRVDPDTEEFRDSLLDAINYIAITWEVS